MFGASSLGSICTGCCVLIIRTICLWLCFFAACLGFGLKPSSNLSGASGQYRQFFPHSLPLVSI